MLWKLKQALTKVSRQCPLTPVQCRLNGHFPWVRTSSGISYQLHYWSYFTGLRTSVHAPRHFVFLCVRVLELTIFMGEITEGRARIFSDTIISLNFRTVKVQGVALITLTFPFAFQQVTYWVSLVSFLPFFFTAHPPCYFRLLFF